MGVEGEAVGGVEAGGGFWAVGSCDGFEGAVWGDSTDEVVAGFGEVEIAVVGDCDAAGRVDGGVGGGRAVGGVSWVAGSCDGVDGAVLVDHTDYVVFVVGEVHVSEGVEGDGCDAADSRLGCRAAVAGVAWEA